MIENYKIKDNTLYLYLNYSYEFSSEIGIIKKIDEYIKNMKIKFNGTKIILVVGGVMLSTIFYNPKANIFDNKYISQTLLPGYTIVNNINTPVIEENKIEIQNEKVNEKTISNSEIVNNDIKENIDTQEVLINEPFEQMITVHRKNGEIINLTMTDYLIGVVSSEMPAEFNIEALKAGAIAARTYALKSIQDGKQLTDTVSTQVYSDNNELKNKWGSSFDKYYNKIKQAVLETDNLVIKYNGELISALYFSTSNGYTESALEVFGYDIPYLQSVESSVDLDTTPYERTITKETSDILNILGINSLNNIEVISRTNSGRIKEIKIDNKIYSGVELRNLLGLRSTDFEFKINDSNVEIVTKGYGHGVGMSQYGANKLASKGYSYKDIIHHYYTNVQIDSVK